MYRFLFISLFSLSLLYGESEPEAAYLTWRSDPTTTMTVQWLAKKGEETHTLFYKEEGEMTWKISLAEQITLSSGLPYVLNRVEIFQLQPGESYLFKPGGWDTKTRKFRTLSSDPGEKLRFVVGGDMYHDELSYLIKTHQTAAKQDPHFAVAGGDIAYSATKHVDNGKPRDERWISFLKAWSDEMVTPDGFSIPVIAAIGNHDVNGRYGQLPKQAWLFYTFFPFPDEKGYRAFDIGSHVSLFILDSGHTNRVYGKQSRWLEQALISRTKVPHTFAAYHVPAYPSVRKYTGPISVQERHYWVPLFEKYGLAAAFEHHDHAYKRTHPIVDGHIVPGGVTYIGDGAYGVKHIRSPESPYKTWYLAQTARHRHFILVTIEGNQRKIEAVTADGQIFDKVEQKATASIHSPFFP